MEKLILNKNHIGLGKRKESNARIFLISGTGGLTINNKEGIQYLQYNDDYLATVWLPLKKLGLEKKFDIIAIVKGGGLTGQAEAIQLGISRQLCKINVKNRSILKPFGLLTRNSNVKERKKYGLRKARKAPQYSKR